MDDNMICISGDKGDAAQLLALPMIIFDDREENLVDVVNKGTARNLGILVRKGGAAHRPVPPRMQRFVIKNPHHWVYWCYKFAQQWPRADLLGHPPRRDLSTSHHLQIDNTQPTENLFAYRRSEYCESLVRRSQQRKQQIESMRGAIAHFQIASTESIEHPQPRCSSSQRPAPCGSRPPTPPLPASLHPSVLPTMSPQTQSQSRNSRRGREQGRNSGNVPNSSGRGSCNQSGGSQKPTYQYEEFGARSAEATMAQQEARAVQIEELKEQLKAQTELLKQMSENATQWQGQSWWYTPASSWDQSWWSNSNWSGSDWHRGSEDTAGTEEVGGTSGHRSKRATTSDGTASQDYKESYVEQAWKGAWTDVGTTDVGSATVNKEPASPAISHPSIGGATEEELSWGPSSTEHDAMVAEQQQQQPYDPWLVADAQPVENKVDPWLVTEREEKIEELEDSELTKRLKHAEETLNMEEDNEGDFPPLCGGQQSRRIS